MKKRLRGWIALALSLMIGLTSGRYVYADALQEETIQNDYVEYTINNQNGRFSIRTNKGLLNRQEDDDQPLLFEDVVPDTSFTTFRIDNEDYIYGNHYGFMGKEGHFIHQPQTLGKTNQSTWTIEGLEITQTLSIVDNPEDKHVGNVKVSYHVRNTKDVKVELGTRILLDTMLGTEDATPITLPGSNVFIHKETDILGDNIPIYWKAVNNSFDKTIMSYGALGGWGNEKPDRMIIGHWEGLSKTKWEYTINQELDFTSKHNQYGSADSAIALMWEPDILEPFEERSYETYYGVGEYASSGSEMAFGVNLFAPDRLRLNATKTAYSQKAFSMGAEIDNTFTDATPLHHVEAGIEFSYGIKLASGETKIKSLDTVAAGELGTLAWRVEPLPQYQMSVVKYKITIHADELLSPIVKVGTIIMPSLSGEAPEIHFTNFSADMIHYEDPDPEITITGNGLMLLMLDDQWNLYFTDALGTQQFPVSKDKIVIRNNESMTVSLPDEVRMLGSYKLCIDYSQYGKLSTHAFEKMLTITNDPRYASREYGILLIEKVEEADGSWAYEFIECENEEDVFNHRYKDILLEFRGDIKKSDGRYTVVSRDVMINSFLTFTYEESSFYNRAPLVIEKLERDLFHGDDYISIQGSGTLSIPGFPFWFNAFEVELVDGEEYTLKPEEDEEAESIEIVFPDIKYVQNIDGFPIRLYNACIRDEGISFGGYMGFNLGEVEEEEEEEEENNNNNGNSGNSGNTGNGNNNNNNDDDDDDDDGISLGKIGVDVDEIRFGYDHLKRFQLQGIRAEGEVGLPEGLIPGLDYGASARLAIDTFDNYKIEMEMEVNFDVIEAEGLLHMKLLDIGGVKLYIPDALYIYGGVEPGIPLIPPVPVAYLKGLGGGFEGLYDTITGNFNVLPPLTLKATCSMDIAKVIEADKITLTASARGMSIYGAGKIVKLPILKEIGGEFRIEDSLNPIVFELSATAKLEIMEVINGEIYFLLGFDSSKQGYLGPITLAGGGKINVTVPESIPFIGGLPLTEINAGISDECIYGGFSFIGIPINIKYRWGDSMPILGSTDGMPSTEGLGQLNYREEDGTYSTITFGDNIRVIGRSDTALADLNGYNMPLVVATAPGASDPYHELSIMNQDYALIEVSYTGEKQDLVLVEPGQTIDHPFVLEEGVNCTYETTSPEESASGLLEQKVYIALVQPENGQWRIYYNKEQAITTILNDVEAQPSITSIQASAYNDTLEVDIEAQYAEGCQMAFYLVTDEKDPGYELATDIPIGSQHNILTIPGHVPSGNYYIRGELKKDGASPSRLLTTNTITYQNNNEPAMPSALSIESMGNGLLEANWQESQDADGYYIQLLNDKGKPIENMGPIQVEGNVEEALIGGHYQMMTQGATPSKASLARDEGEQGGLIPGNAYKVSIRAYREVNGMVYTSHEMISQSTYIPEPNPASLSLTLPTLEGLQEKTDQSGSSYYLYNGDSITSQLTANQVVDTRIIVDGNLYQEIEDTEAWTETVPLHEGENNILVEATNSNGDTSMAGLRIVVDTTLPDLKVETQVTEDDMIQVTGKAEVGSTVAVNHEPVSIDEEGFFLTNLSIDGLMEREVTVTALDEAGNNTIYTTKVENTNVSIIDHVVIEPVTGTLEPGESREFTLVAVDDKDDHYIMTQNMVRWELLSGEGIASISDEGILTTSGEGEVIVKASYGIAHGYAYEDAMVIRVTEEGETAIKGIDIRPPYVQLQVDEHEMMAVYRVENDLSTIPVDQSDVQWQIISGDDVITLSESGKVIGKKAGVAVIMASVSYLGQVYKDTEIITVHQEQTNPTTGHKETLDEADKKILDSIKELILQESNTRLLISQILSRDGVTAIQVNGKLRLTIPLQKFRAGIGIGQIIDSEAYAGESMTLYSPIYEFILDQPLLFEEPVTLMMTYDQAQVEDAQKIAIYYYNEVSKRWEYVGGKVNTKDHTVTVMLHHFSKYALGYDSSLIKIEDIGDRWSRDTIYRLVSKKVINGINKDGLYYYEPTRYITRQEFAKMVVEAMDTKVETMELSKVFADGDTIEEWAVPYISTVVREEWMNGITKNEKQYFMPRERMTRAQAATLLGRVIHEENQNSQVVFTDQKGIPKWAADHVMTLASIGIITGYPDKTYRANSHITREEAAVMIARLLDWMEEKKRYE